MSGGYGGLHALEPLTAEAEGDDLSDEERATVMAATAEAAAGTGPPGGVRPVPDSFHYVLTVQDQGDSHRLTYDDRTLPASLRPLVQRLRRQALEERGGGGGADGGGGGGAGGGGGGGASW